MAARPFVEDEWPDRLRRGVLNALTVCRLEFSDWVEGGFDVHHIVAAGLDGAAPGRRILARWSIGVHSVANAAIVPRRFHQGQGLHRQEFLHSVNLRLSSAAMFAEAVLPHGGFAAGRLIIVQTMQKIGIELAARSEDAAAIRLQSVLHALVAEMTSGSGGKRTDVGGRAASQSDRDRSQGVASGARLSSAGVPPPWRPSVSHAAAGS